MSRPRSLLSALPATDRPQRRRYREQALAYLDDDSVPPVVLRRLAERDPERGSVVFRRLLKKPRFDWTRDSEDLLREFKPDHFQRVPRLRLSSVGDRLAGYARQR